MNVAQLFISIGVKGDSPAAKALTGIKGILNDLKSTSLGAKAALAGVVYGMEQIMTQAAKRGQDLTKFSNLTGLSAQELQKWQYAARQSGVAGEDMEGSIVGVQKAMTSMITGFGAPKGMGIFTETMARAGKAFDPGKARDTFYVLSKLREFAQITPPDISNEVLASFGLSPDTIQFMRSSKLEIEKIKPTNIYSDAEIKQLNKIAVGWDNLWHSLKVFQGHEVARFGLPIVEELNSAVTFVTDLIKGIEKLIKQFPLLGQIGKAAMILIGAAMIAFGGPLTALSAAVTGLVFLFGELGKMKGKEPAGTVGGGMYGVSPEQVEKSKKQTYAPEYVPLSKRFEQIGGFFSGLMGAKTSPVSPVSPNLRPTTGGGTKQEVNVTQTNHFSGVPSPKKHADDLKKEINKGLRTLSAQQQGA